MLVAALVFLTACGFEYGDGLLSLPKLPSQYITLQHKLDAVLDAGAFLATPDEGANRQAVQLIDIDGDGVEEAIAFFREPGGQHRIYVYRRAGKDYVLVGSVDGYGSSIQSVYYPRIGDGGRLALAVSWRSDETSLIGMTVYGIGEAQVDTVLDVSYSSFGMGDVSGEGVDELFFIIRDTASNALYTRLYSYADGKYNMTAEAPLCLEARSVSSMKIGLLSPGQTALFVDSAAIGGGYVTDVLKITGSGMMTNETIYPSTGSGIETWRAIQVFSSDIDGDGIMEIPSSLKTTPEGGEVGYNLVWNKAAGGAADKEVRTYHNVTDEWFFYWPELWGDEVTVKRGGISSFSVVSFQVKTDWVPDVGGDLEGAQPNGELLRIYTFTGDSRWEFYENQGVKRLGSQGSLLFGYSLSASDFDEYKIDEDQVRQRFKVIEKTWSID